MVSMLRHILGAGAFDLCAQHVLIDDDLTRPQSFTQSLKIAVGSNSAGYVCSNRTARHTQDEESEHAQTILSDTVRLIFDHDTSR
jgi:hypothetical protein